MGISLDILVEKTVSSIQDRKLCICLACHTLSLVEAPEMCLPGGELYSLAVQCHGKLKDGQKYTFPLHSKVLFGTAP